MEELRDPAERALLRRRRVVPRKPAQLRHVVGRRGLSRHDLRLPDEVEHASDLRALSVGVDERAEELPRLDLEVRLLEELAPEAVERVLAFLEKSAEQVPEAGVRLVGAT